MIISVLLGIFMLSVLGYSQDAFGFAYVFSDTSHLSERPFDESMVMPRENMIRGEIAPLNDEVFLTLDVMPDGFEDDFPIIDVVSHPLGYTGTGGTLNISIGIDPTSEFAANMADSVQNAIDTFNSLNPTTQNIVSGGDNNIPEGQVDFESVFLHEMTHSMGLHHVNLATESLLLGPDRDYTKSTPGPNMVFDIDAGIDLVIGSSDDLRGDDVNLNYFKKSDNNPFTISETIDSSTYSRDTSLLPGGHNYSANPSFDVAALLGIPNTEAVMQQGTFFDESQRTFGHDDVAGIRYAMTGTDEITGGGDDYTINLTYAGLDANADIVVDFDNSETGFAAAALNASFLGNHLVITEAKIFFHNGSSWFFNDRTIVPGTLNVTKIVITDDGGTAIPSNFTITVNGNNPNPAMFAGNSSGTIVSIEPGSYSVTEVGPSGYGQTNSADCSSTISSGENKTCIITNDDVAPCTPPPGQDWVISINCTLTGSVTADKNIIVQDNAVLTIPNGFTVFFDPANFSITIKFGSGILVQQGGSIQTTP